MSLSYSAVPQDLVMPAMPQLITTVIYGLGALVFVVYAIVLSRRYKSLLPLYAILGALLTIYLEPVVDVLGNAVHPQIGQYNVLTTNGHPVPWAVLLGYVWYFAGAILLTYKPFVEQKLLQKHVWQMVGVVILGAAIVEQIPLHFGTWIYYGDQWPKIGYIPLWWIFANTAAVTVPFLFIYKLIPKLKGAGQSLVVLLIPSGAFMGHAGSGWPMYNLLGTQTELVPAWLMVAGSFGCVFLSLMLVWVLMQLIGMPTDNQDSR